MRVKDPREPSGWRDEGPSSALVSLPLAGSARLTSGGAIAEGRCPICNIKMQDRANQRSCIKLPRDNSWRAMRKKGRGGFRYGSNLNRSEAA